jgi:hypothetical protein
MVDLDLVRERLGSSVISDILDELARGAGISQVYKKYGTV